MKSRGINLGLGSVTVLVALLALVTYVAFLAETPFYSKGEPREAVVALSMLQQHDWILPLSCGTDIPYKPPMLAWCIAILGWLNGGVVTEFLSRLPSALAMVVLAVATLRFLARRSSPTLAVVATLVLMTTFEAHRAATSCRVDMLLTMFMVLALYALYRQWELRGDTWCPSLWGALLMSGAVLTKGPVGMLLPCAIIFLFRLLQGGRWWPALVSVGLSGVLSLVLPALWYVAAYHQGGQEFARLALEENFGRFTGGMTYESHEHTLWYYFPMLLAGISPYSLLLILSAFVLPWRRWAGRWRHGLEGRLRGMLGSCQARWQSLHSLEAFALLASVVIFLFYCIPSSKRSVYLLPMYPFVAFGIALAIRRLARGRYTWPLRAYGWVIVAIGIAAPVATVILFHPTATGLLATCIVEAAALGSIRLMCRHDIDAIVQWTLVDTILIYWLFTAAIQPAVLTPKSDRPAAEAIAHIVPADEPVYAYYPDKYTRFYCLDFYLGDRLRHTAIPDNPRSAELPNEGYLLVGDREQDQQFLDQLLTRGYALRTLHVDSPSVPFRSPSTRRGLRLLQFSR